VLNSGIYQKDTYDQAMNGWVRPLSNMAGQYQDVQGGFAQAGQQLAFIRGEGLKDIEDAETNRLAMEQIAASIRAAS